MSEPRPAAKIHVGTSVLSRDLVWCECDRGLSLSGKWLYCPNCGRSIDQDSYHAAVEQATRNGARLYRDSEMVEQLRALEEQLQAARAALGNLLCGDQAMAPSPMTNTR